MKRAVKWESFCLLPAVASKFIWSSHVFRIFTVLQKYADSIWTTPWNARANNRTKNRIKALFTPNIVVSLRYSFWWIEFLRLFSRPLRWNLATYITMAIQSLRHIYIIVEQLHAIWAWLGKYQGYHLVVLLSFLQFVLGYDFKYCIF